GQELDHVVALVHAMLDQRIAGERADDEQAGLARFELRAERGERIGALTREIDPAAFDKPARRFRAGAGDDPVAADRLLAVTRAASQLAVASDGGRSLANHDVAPRRRDLGQQRDVRPARARESGAAIEYRDDVALRRVCREAERVLDPGIARSDDGDVLVVRL